MKKPANGTPSGARCHTRFNSFGAVSNIKQSHFAPSFRVAVGSSFPLSNEAHKLGRSFELAIGHKNMKTNPTEGRQGC